MKIFSSKTVDRKFLIKTYNFKEFLLIKKDYKLLFFVVNVFLDDEKQVETIYVFGDFIIMVKLNEMKSHEFVSSLLLNW